MKRTEKYQDTTTFHFYNANPKGRITGDCWCRAICTGLNIPYNTVVLEMAQLHCETGYDSASEGIERYLKQKGWVKHKQPRKSDNTKYTGKEFCESIAQKHKRYIAKIGGHHIVAIVNNQVQDIWDSTYKTIGNYWTKD